MCVISPFEVSVFFFLVDARLRFRWRKSFHPENTSTRVKSAPRGLPTAATYPLMGIRSYKIVEKI